MKARLRHTYRALAALGVCACALLAGPESYEGKRIATIQFVPRDQPVDLEEIHRILPLRINTPLRLSDVRAAIERLFATGHYLDIQVDAEPRNGEVVLRFLTVSSWFIGQVSVEGQVSEPPNRGQLINAANLRQGEPLSEDKVREAVHNLERTLEDNGFYESKIEPRYDYDPRTQQVHVRFLIETGRRARYWRPEVSGDLKMPAATIVSATRWKGWLGWRPVTQNRTQRGLARVREKYQDQDRLMAGVALDSLDYHPGRRPGVTPKLQVSAGPRVEVRTFGAKVSRGKLKRLIPIYEERTVDRDLLEEGVRNLRDYFQSQGYFDAEVVVKQQRVVKDRAAIDYLINLGKGHKLVKVDITGSRYFDAATLRERMFLLPASFQFRHGRYSESLRRRDEEAIADLYRENGFRDVTVASTVTDDYQGKPGHLAVAIQIEEGPQWYVSRLEVEGVEQLSRERVLARLSSTPGQPFSDFNVAVDRDSILALYFTEGFPNAAFEWSSRPSDKPHHVDLRFVIREGERRFVRQVLISGLDTTQPGLVNRNLLLSPGDPLSQIQMAETQRRLYDLGVFARVNMAIQNPEGETANKYVLYQMEEAKKYSITSGLGAELARIGGARGSLEDPGGRAGFAPRVSLDVSRRNLLGRGHVASFRSRLSTLQRRALVNYSAPRLGNIAGLNLSFTALYDDSTDVRTFSAIRREGSVQLSQRLSKADTALYRFSYRRVSVGSLAIDPLLVPQLAQPARIGMLSGNLIGDRRDDPTDARKGAYNTLDLGFASRIFGSQADFTRALARNSSYHALSKRLVLARSINFGWLYPISFRVGETRTREIPLAERLFSGGAGSHRGFPENQAGPRDLTTGFPLGGRALLMNNTEIRFPVAGDNLSGVLFHDAGNVYSALEKISFRVRQRDLNDFDYMVHAMGLGVRYRTPIGPVRLDLAYSINSPQFKGCTGTTTCGAPTEQRISRFQFHFSIGQAF